MPRMPRTDPLWFVIPALALLIALGWPTRFPLNPRADAAMAIAPTRGPRTSHPAFVSFRIELAAHGDIDSADPRGGGGVPSLRGDPSPGTSSGGPASAAPSSPPPRAATSAPPSRAGVAVATAPGVAMPAAPAGDRSTGPVPSSPETNPRLPGPRATRPGEPWRPALSPPAADQSGGGASRPPAPPPGASTARTGVDGRPVLHWPLAGQVSVSRAFERPANPFGPGHRGIDLQALPGTPIRAAADGTVSYAGPVAGRGVVVVGHGAVRTTYEPLLPTVRVGDAVRAGDQLGRLAPGHPGCPAAACLHWGLLRAADYLDPLASFRRVSPRLLPVSGR